jgi:catechol-2,3-dioxygenase
MEVRGISDHTFVDSIYFRDPNGYVVELSAKRPGHDEAMNPATNGARTILDTWQERKTAG